MAEIPIGGAGGLAAAGKPPAAAGPALPLSSEAASADSKITPPEEAPALGAGGSSPAAAAPGTDNGLGVGKGSGVGKAAGAAAAIPAAGVAGQAIVMAMFINYLKGMMMSLAALASNLWGLAMGLALSAGKAVLGVVMGIGTAVSGAVGGTISAVAAGVTSAVSAVAIGTLLVVGVVTGVGGDNALALKDGALDCGVTATSALNKIDGSDGAIDAQTLANAKTIYGVLGAWGMPDENIAGIIGNWDAESKVDPTSVQGFFSSPQVMSEEKLNASTDTDNGIGLGQWTFGRNSALRTYAEGHEVNWWTLETQLGFMISAAEGSNATIVKGMIETSQGTPVSAAMYFHDEWERSADTPAMAQRRGEMATKWMGMFGGWFKNKALADSILAQAGTTVTGANTVRAAAVRSDCIGVGEAPTYLADGNAPGPWGGYLNGKIAAHELSAIPWSDLGPMFLRPDATESLGQLNTAFKSEFGHNLPINSAYRDYAGQVEARNNWCAMGSCQNAAPPGTSNHGWALAVDIGTKSHQVIGFDSAEYRWLKKNAGRYGWVHPAYMEPGGSGPLEAWHWEYYGVA